MTERLGSPVVVVAAAVLALVLVIASVAVLRHDGAGDGAVIIELEPGPREAEAVVKDSGAFAHAVETINEEIDLPSDLKVRVGDGEAARLGISGPTYEPKDRTVYFPWSFVEESHEDLERLKGRHRLTRDSAVHRVLEDAMVFVLYHELAHGLFDILDVPVVGGEEPTADSLAAVIAISSPRDRTTIPVQAALLEEARAERAGGTPSLLDYADDHGFDRQRAFDANCFVYGSSPRRFGNLLGEDLPPSRAELCPFEYSSNLRSWRRLLTDHLTEDGGLRPLESSGDDARARGFAR